MKILQVLEDRTLPLPPSTCNFLLFICRGAGVFMNFFFLKFSDIWKETWCVHALKELLSKGESTSLGV